MIYLDVEDVLMIHLEQITNYGGDAAIRDHGLLESAIAQPQATFGGQLLHESVAQAAAAYLFHLAKNHPFVDGNKRTALASMLVFLTINGHDIRWEPDEAATITEGVASGTVSKEALTEAVAAAIL